MDVMESLRYAMRRRIVQSAGIVGPAEYQQEWQDAPKADCYLRETLIPYSREEDFQASELITALCEYDVFVRKGAFPSPTAKAYELGARLLAEFNIKSPDKIEVALENWTGGVSAAVARYDYGSVAQEEELFRLPVLIYVEISFPAGAVYGG